MNDSENNLDICGDRLYSARFDDHYASQYQPEAEKEYVFCAGNQLGERFAAAAQFTLFELGFGSGLSFLVAARHWLHHAAADATLDFISIEQYPLSREQLRRALEAFPALSELADELVCAWPTADRGFHRLNLFNERVRLTLILEDAGPTLRHLDYQVDAWFLDGFAPSKNPQMWHPDLYREMNRLSKETATLATYTAAGQVRRDLIEAGFSVKRAPGFGPKRERLVGHFAQRIERREQRSPWFIAPHQPRPAHAIIIGAGITGCAMANRLAARGIAITLIDKAGQIATEASSNPCAIMHPYFTLDNNATAQLAQQGFLYTLQTVRRLNRKGLDSSYRQTGMVMRPKNAKDGARQAQIAAQSPHPPAFVSWHDKTSASQLANTPLETAGWHVPEGGWLSLAAFSRALISEHATKIALQPRRQVASLSYDAQGWHALDESGALISSADAVIVSNGNAMKQISQTRYLPLTPNRGQVLYAGASQHGLSASLCGGGYCVAIDEDHLCLGSTYETGVDHCEIAAGDREKTLEKARRHTPTLASQLNEEIMLDWSQVRTTLPDRLPIIGAVTDPASFVDTFGPMFRGERRRIPAATPTLPGLFAFTGVGSRAVAYTLLCAEALACDICSSPSPLSRKVRDALDINRFLVREAFSKMKAKQGAKPLR